MGDPCALINAPLSIRAAGGRPEIGDYPTFCWPLDKMMPPLTVITHPSLSNWPRDRSSTIRQHYLANRYQAILNSTPKKGEFLRGRRFSAFVIFHPQADDFGNEPAFTSDWQNYGLSQTDPSCLSGCRQYSISQSATHDRHLIKLLFGRVT